MSITCLYNYGIKFVTLWIEINPEHFSQMNNSSRLDHLTVGNQALYKTGTCIDKRMENTLLCKMMFILVIYE